MTLKQIVALNQKTGASHMNGSHNSAKHGCWYCAQASTPVKPENCPHQKK